MATLILLVLLAAPIKIFSITDDNLSIWQDDDEAAYFKDNRVCAGDLECQRHCQAGGREQNGCCINQPKSSLLLKGRVPKTCQCCNYGEACESRPKEKDQFNEEDITTLELLGWGGNPPKGRCQCNENDCKTFCNNLNITTDPCCVKSRNAEGLHYVCECCNDGTQCNEAKSRCECSTEKCASDKVCGRCDGLKCVAGAQCSDGSTCADPITGACTCSSDASEPCSDNSCPNQNGQCKCTIDNCGTGDGPTCAYCENDGYTCHEYSGCKDDGICFSEETGVCDCDCAADKDTCENAEGKKSFFGIQRNECVPPCTPDTCDEGGCCFHDCPINSPGTTGCCAPYKYDSHTSPGSLSSSGSGIDCKCCYPGQECAIAVTTTTTENGDGSTTTTLYRGPACVCQDALCGEKVLCGKCNDGECSNDGLVCPDGINCIGADGSCPDPEQAVVQYEPATDPAGSVTVTITSSNEVTCQVPCLDGSCPDPSTGLCECLATKQQCQDAQGSFCCDPVFGFSSCCTGGTTCRLSTDGTYLACISGSSTCSTDNCECGSPDHTECSYCDYAVGGCTTVQNCGPSASHRNASLNSETRMRRNNNHNNKSSSLSKVFPDQCGCDFCVEKCFGENPEATSCCGVASAPGAAIGSASLNCVCCLKGQTCVVSATESYIGPFCEEKECEEALCEQKLPCGKCNSGICSNDGLVCPDGVSCIGADGSCPCASDAFCVDKLQSPCGKCNTQTGQCFDDKCMDGSCKYPAGSCPCDNNYCEVECLILIGESYDYCCATNPNDVTKNQCNCCAEAWTTCATSTNHSICLCDNVRCNVLYGGCGRCNADKSLCINLGTCPDGSCKYEDGSCPCETENCNSACLSSIGKDYDSCCVPNPNDATETMCLCCAESWTTCNTNSKTCLCDSDRCKALYNGCGKCNAEGTMCINLGSCSDGSCKINGKCPAPPPVSPCPDGTACKEKCRKNNYYDGCCTSNGAGNPNNYDLSSNASNAAAFPSWFKGWGWGSGSECVCCRYPYKCYGGSGGCICDPTECKYEVPCGECLNNRCVRKECPAGTSCDISNGQQNAICNCNNDGCINKCRFGKKPVGCCDSKGSCVCCLETHLCRGTGGKEDDDIKADDEIADYFADDLDEEKEDDWKEVGRGWTSCLCDQQKCNQVCNGKCQQNKCVPNCRDGYQCENKHCQPTGGWRGNGNGRESRWFDFNWF